LPSSFVASVCTVLYIIYPSSLPLCPHPSLLLLHLCSLFTFLPSFICVLLTSVLIKQLSGCICIHLAAYSSCIRVYLSLPPLVALCLLAAMWICLAAFFKPDALCNFCMMRLTSGMCGGSRYLSKNGQVTLTSPDYPAHYASNLDCTWNIRGPAGGV